MVMDGHTDIHTDIAPLAKMRKFLMMPSLLIQPFIVVNLRIMKIIPRNFEQTSIDVLFVAERTLMNSC